MSPEPLEMIRTSLGHEEPERVPVVPLVGLFSTTLSGAAIFKVLLDHEEQARSIIKALRMYGYDGVFNVMDLTVEAEALGAEVVYPENAFPYLKDHPFGDLDEVTNLDLYDSESSRISTFVETTRCLSETIGSTHLVSSYVIGPFTLLGHLVGVEYLLEETLDDSQGVKETLETCVSLLSPYVSDLIDAGAHNIVILEPTASNSVISPPYFDLYSRPYVKQMIDDIHSQDAFATLHICGKTDKIISLMCDTGADALSIDSAVDLASAKKEARGRASLIGNVDTTLLLQGEPEAVSIAANSCLKQASQGGGFLLSSGCDIPIETPVANFEALIQAVLE